MRARGRSPSNGALAEALFALSEHEPPGERRVAIMRAGYTAFDCTGPASKLVLAEAPRWLRPLVEQLLECPGPEALEAAVQRLAGSRKPRRCGARERYLTRQEAEAIVASGDKDLSPRRLRGDFHWHTTDSDGRASLETMARACSRRGTRWSVVCDHSGGLEVASGLDRHGIALQRRRVERWNKAHGEDHRLFQGLEVEILEDGTVDVPHAERLEIDCVVAAVHRLFDPDRDQTERLLRAISTPGVDAFAHPRGRYFHYRPGLRARWEKVFAACVDEGVAVEINGFPRRQDLDWELTRLANSSGCTFVLASDAHAPNHLEFDVFACAIAMRAGIGREDVLNVRQPEDLADGLSDR